MVKLDGKIALITGGNSGIGLATAKQFVKEGAYVYITARREPELAAAVQEIGSNVTGPAGDVSNSPDLDRLFAQIKRAKDWQRIASIAPPRPPCAPSPGPGQPTLKARRIRVNAVSPGSTDTPGFDELLASSEAGEQRRKMISSLVPLGRLGTPDEIAKAVVFLASDDASYITGIELFVDGGFAQI